MELIVNVLTDHDALVEERISTKAIERCNVNLSELGITICQQNHITCTDVNSYEPDKIVEKLQLDNLIPRPGLALFFSSVKYHPKEKTQPLPSSKLDYYFLCGRYWGNCALIFDAVNNAQRYDAGGNRLIDTIILHEIGHHMGLDHNERMPSIMYPISKYSVGLWGAKEKSHIRNWPHSQLTRLIAKTLNTAE